MGRASALAFAPEGALVVGCDPSVDAAAPAVELVRGSGEDMVSKGRLGRPEELAKVAVFRASDASSSTTGDDILFGGAMKVW